jgi:hypothetical protein
LTLVVRQNLLQKNLLDQKFDSADINIFGLKDFSVKDFDGQLASISVLITTYNKKY